MPSTADRAVIALGGAGMVVALLVRAASAVAAYAGAQEVFRYQATHDGLTGLPNRAAVTAITDRLLLVAASIGLARAGHDTASAEALLRDADGLGRGSEDEEIVRAVVAMASALGLSVVAEGVELEAQRQVPESFGVQYGQGHLWGRAVDPVAFAVSPAATRTRRPDEVMAAPPRGG